ncbi:MAG: response regulator transcription factor [Acidobacteria bacterium]|nr:response regulator transcription factor [Acidobacteriota bacterium]
MPTTIDSKIPPVRVLVVEDDPAISHFLVRGLQEEHFRVDLAEDGMTAERLAGDESYDAIILDILLPGQDGFAVCRRLRRDGVDTPVLMLTARDAVPDRVQGLNVGADDYLVKPFAFDELLARLRALTRRGRTRQLDTSLTYGPIEMDTTTHLVRAGQRQLDLSATEYRLLEHLLRHTETIVSRDQLAEHVWGGEYDPFSNVADVYIGYLRRKLRAAGIDAPLIHTIRGMGYLLKTRRPEDEIA